MKILNRILSVLVLLTAIVAGVFSYLLFEKRDQMVKGWLQMSAEIQKTAAILDKDSGTVLASSLNSDKLKHRQDLGVLQTNLSSLSKGAEALVAQRNNLANALVRTAKNAEYNGAKVEDLKKLATSDKAQNDIAGNVLRLRQRNDGIIGQYVVVGNKLGQRGYSVSSLKSGQSGQFQKKVLDAVSERDRKISVFSSGLRTIASVVENGPVMKGNDYAGWTKNVSNAVVRQRTKLRDTASQLKNKENECRTMNSRIASLNKTIDSKNAAIASLEKNIQKLRDLLNPSKDPDLDREFYVAKTKDDFLKFYQMVRGRVSHVDKDWGFVLINIGKKYELKRVIAGKTFRNVLNIPEGEDMTIIRGLDSKSPKYIGKVRLTQVFPTYAIADIRTTGSSISVGDDVVFQLNDARKLISNPQATTQENQ